MKALIRNRGRRGFTLIELMIVVAIIGILAVLAIYGVSRYLKTSKTAEATNNLGAIAKNAGEAYVREKMSGAYLAPGTSVGTAYGLCATAVPVPATIASVKAGKYSSGPTDWNSATPDPLVGWYCLKFTVDQPQYYMYSYTATTTTVGPVLIEANGDLDGVGGTSSFLMEGNVVVPANGAAALIMAPKPLETNPED